MELDEKGLFIYEREMNAFEKILFTYKTKKKRMFLERKAKKGAFIFMLTDLHTKNVVKYYFVVFI